MKAYLVGFMAIHVSVSLVCDRGVSWIILAL